MVLSPVAFLLVAVPFVNWIGNVPEQNYQIQKRIIVEELTKLDVRERDERAFRIKYSRALDRMVVEAGDEVHERTREIALASTRRDTYIRDPKSWHDGQEKNSDYNSPAYHMKIMSRELLAEFDEEDKETIRKVEDALKQLDALGLPTYHYGRQPIGEVHHSLRENLEHYYARDSRQAQQLYQQIRSSTSFVSKLRLKPELLSEQAFTAELARSLKREDRLRADIRMDCKVSEPPSVARPLLMRWQTILDFKDITEKLMPVYDTCYVLLNLMLSGWIFSLLLRWRMGISREDAGILRNGVLCIIGAVSLVPTLVFASASIALDYTLAYEVAWWPQVFPQFRKAYVFGAFVFVAFFSVRHVNRIGPAYLNNEHPTAVRRRLACLLLASLLCAALIEHDIYAFVDMQISEHVCRLRFEGSDSFLCDLQLLLP